MSFTIAEQATTGFSNASHYDQYRPSYPAEAVDRLLENLGVASVNDARIIDLACGTGKFTELLAARPEQYEIVGVEPHHEMRGELIKKDLGSNVKVLEGSASNMPIEEGWADALIAAQSFHWFATEDALNEIHRVLRPGGAFGLIWNIDDYNGPKSWTPTTKLDRELKDVVEGMEDGHPRFRHLTWRQVFEKPQDTTPSHGDTSTRNRPLFSLPLGEDHMTWTVWLSDEGVWSRLSTISYIASQQGEDKERIRKRVFDALKDPSTVRNADGKVAIHGTTYIFWTSRV